MDTIITLYQAFVHMDIKTLSNPEVLWILYGMQDYGRAVIVGETTYGKGTVQTSRNISYPVDARIHPKWPELGGAQYTVQKFYRINGGSTQLKGVEPDIEMTNSQYVDETGERFLDNAMPWDKIPSADYATLPILNHY